MNAPARITRMMATFFTWSNCHVLKRTQKHHEQHGTTIVRFLYLTIVRSILIIANLSRGPYHPKHPDPGMELKRRVGGYFKYTGGEL